MPDIQGVFWDVGGVLLTNGWDRVSRRAGAERFGLDWDEFEGRHDEVSAAFEIGRLGLDDYLDRTVFHRSRTITKQAFKEFMLAQSQPHPEALSIAKRVAGSGNRLMATLNNESLELNLYRINRFELRRYFTLFLSSCFLGVRKPDEAIYGLALQLTQLDPATAVFLDDRLINLECARASGMHTIHYQSPAQLQDELRRLDIHI